MNDMRITDIEQRRLVQQIVDGSIPAGKEFEECRTVLQTESDEKLRFDALFTLLQGAMADPLVAIGDTRTVSLLLRGLARGDLRVEELL